MSVHDEAYSRKDRCPLNKKNIRFYFNQKKFVMFLAITTNIQQPDFFDTELYVFIRASKDIVMQITR
jgi:hypothetical protein